MTTGAQRRRGIVRCSTSSSVASEACLTDRFLRPINRDRSFQPIAWSGAFKSIVNRRHQRWELVVIVASGKYTISLKESPTRFRWYSIPRFRMSRESTAPLHDLASEVIQVKAREHVFRAGSGAHHVYFVSRGRVVLSRHTDDGNRVITSDVVEGDWMAEASVFESRYHCDAAAVVDSVIRRVRCEDILEALRSRPEFTARYVAYLSRRVRHLREQLEIRTILSAEDRILRFLQAEVVDGIFVVPGFYKNLAAQIGITHETLYRQLKTLEKKGFIRRANKEITLLRGGARSSGKTARPI